MTNEEKLIAIDSWQNDIRMHPMTCGTLSHHPPLSGSVRKGEVILICNVCSYTQEVPDLVYLAYEQGGLSTVCSMEDCNTKLTRDNSDLWIADIKVVGSDKRKAVTRVCKKCRKKLESGSTNALSMGCIIKR
jgi:hypothetical protein